MHEHHTVGLIIAALTLLAFISVPLLKLRAFHTRWYVDAKAFPGLPDGPAIRVRFELGKNDTGWSQATLEKSIAVGLAKTFEVIRETLPRTQMIDDVLVIVRTEGQVNAGYGLGGETKSERELPIFRIRPVVVVQRPSIAYYLAHEIAQHATSFHMGLGFNPGHSNPVLATIEREAKRRIAIALGSVGGDMTLAFD